jgi:hypothetical protein
MANWVPTREQDLVDLCQKWKTGLSDAANITAFGWNQSEVTAVVGAVDAFLTARAAYEDDDSSKNRLTKDRGGTIAAFGGIYERLYPRQAKDLGIAAIYQDIDLVDNLTVADNIFLGSELVKKTALLIPENRNKLPTAFLIN